MAKLSGIRSAFQTDIYGLLREHKQAFADTLAGSGNKLRVTLERERDYVIERIHKTAEMFRESITAKEMELCYDVNEIFESERRRREEEMVGISQRVLSVAQGIENELMKTLENRGPTEKASLLRQIEGIQELNNELKQREMQNLSNKPVIFDPEEPQVRLGTLEYLGARVENETKEAKAGFSGRISRPLTRTAVKYSKHCKLVRELDLPVELKTNFCPWAVSVSRHGLIGVVDRGNANVILFDQTGEFIRLIARPRRYAKTSEHEVYGMTFLSDDTIVIAYYSPCRSSGSMELFDHVSGKHLRCLVPLARPAYITSDAEDRIAVVYYLGCDDNAPVQIYSKDGPLCARLELPEQSLIHPHKAVLQNDMVFVSDSDLRSNIGTVKVFDEAGYFVSSLENSELWKVNGIGHAFKIAADPVMGTLLVYHSLSKQANVYSCAGRVLEARIRLPPGIVDLAVTSDHQLVVSFGKCCESPNTVKIFSLHD